MWHLLTSDLIMYAGCLFNLSINEMRDRPLSRVYKEFLSAVFHVVSLVLSFWCLMSTVIGSWSLYSRYSLYRVVEFAPDIPCTES